MCSYITQPTTLNRDAQNAIPRPPSRPEGLRRGIRDPHAAHTGPTHLPGYALRDATAEDVIDGPWANDPFTAPRRPQRPEAETYTRRGSALKWPDRDPGQKHLFSRPLVPTTLGWEQMPRPGSAHPTAYATSQGALRPQAWAIALRHGGSPLTIREDHLPGEVLMANWPIWRQRKPVAISAVDALRGAEQIRLRIIGTRVAAVVRRGPLSFFVTVAIGETARRPAHFTPAGAILSASMKIEARKLLTDAGLLTGKAWRFDTAIDRCHEIERRVRRHLVAAFDAAAQRTWTDVRAELVAANDVAAPLRHPASAVRLGPALDPDLYGDGPRPKTRRRDAEHAAKAVLGRLAHAVRKLQRHAPQETETLPLAAE